MQRSVSIGFAERCYILICKCVGSLLVKIWKLSKGAKIRNRYNQVPHLTQDTNGKVTNSQLDTTNESQKVRPFPAGDHKAHISRLAQRHSKHKTKKHKRFNALMRRFIPKPLTFLANFTSRPQGTTHTTYHGPAESKGKFQSLSYCPKRTIGSTKFKGRIVNHLKVVRRAA